MGGTEYLNGITGYVIENLYNGGGDLVNKTKHYYFGINSVNYPWGGPPPNTTNAINGEPWQNGREFQTDLFASNGSTLLRSTINAWYQSQPIWFQGYSQYAPSNNPHVSQTITLLADSNQVSKRTFNYDSKNNLTDTYEYDFGGSNGTPGSFLRRSHSDYLSTNPINNVDYLSDSVHLINLPSQSWVSSDVNGNSKVSFTKYEYDNYASDSTHAPLVDRTNITGHDQTYGTSLTTRGNVTKVTSFANAQNQTGGVSTYLQYDIAGNTVKGIDAKGAANTLDYTDRFGSPDNEARSNLAPSILNGQLTFAFATSATNANGWTGYVQHDYYSGSVVDTEDMNGNISTTYYNDVLDRPTQTISNNNRSGLRTQATVVYDDTNKK